MTRKSAAESAIAADEGSEVEHGTRFFNRELSALEYNAQLLACAKMCVGPRSTAPASWRSSARNLDEFFQIRVSGLREQADARSPARRPTGWAAAAARRDSGARASSEQSGVKVAFARCRDRQPGQRSA